MNPGPRAKRGDLFLEKPTHPAPAPPRSTFNALRGGELSASSHRGFVPVRESGGDEEDVTVDSGS